MKWCIIFYLFIIVYGENAPKVEIKYGKLEGKFMITRKGREITGFLGIPFGKPPINELRFKDALSAEPWLGVRKANEDGPACTQRDIFTGSSNNVLGTEDCLYLNVYTPKLPANENEVFPVMVFLHGGGFACGSGHSSFYGPEYILDEDVVLVVPNYRLGPLGFISTQDDVVPGNMGLKDQVLALKWIQENIVKFGGDPNSVTIFGESAGGASVHYHMLSPLSTGLFHRAIAQSGTSINSWAISPEKQIRKHTEKLAKSFNCPTDHSEDMVECLRTLDAKEMVDKVELFLEWDIEPIIPFKPVVEHDHPNAFINADPRQIMEEGKINPATLIMGMTSSEGSMRAATLYPKPNVLKEFSNKFDEILPMSLFYEITSPDVESVTKQIKEFYFKDKEVGNETLQEIIDLYTDGWFMEGIFDTLKLHLNHATTPVYMYYFDYRGSSSISVIFDNTGKDYGVCHGDDLLYLFKFINFMFPNKSISETDSKVTDVMTHVWTNFAKTGKPTLNNKEIWKPVSSENIEYLHIKNDKDLKMDINLLKERVDFWSSLPTRKDKMCNKKDEF